MSLARGIREVRRALLEVAWCRVWRVEGLSPYIGINCTGGRGWNYVGPIDEKRHKNVESQAEYVDKVGCVVSGKNRYNAFRTNDRARGVLIILDLKHVPVRGPKRTMYTC